MEKHVRLSLQSTLILLALGISLQVSAQPQVLTEIPTNSKGFITIGSLVYFSAGDELWRTNGTAEGTFLLKTGFSEFRHFREFNGMAIFGTPQELWRSDGTPEGTVLLKTGGSLYPVGQTPGYLFFRGHEDATGGELYRTDGTVAGTIIVRDIQPGIGSGFNSDAASVGSYLLFPGYTSEHGLELWKSDGTAEGTVLVKDINPGPADGYRAWEEFSFGNRLYFKGHTPENGTEPWVSDGTSQNTMLLKDTSPEDDGIYLNYHIANGGTLYFSTHGDHAELWKTNGTSSSTVKIRTFLNEEYPYHSFEQFLVYNDEVYFFDQYARQYDFWRTNGTTDGTILFHSHPLSNSHPHFFQVVNDHILFYFNDRGYPGDFKRTDGTSSGTQTFTQFKSAAYDNGPRTVTKVNDLVFYGDHDGAFESDVAEDNYFQLMQTDGFTTQAVRDLHGASYVGTDNIVNLNGKVLFTTRNDHPESTDRKKRLWIYDPAKPIAHFTLVNADTDDDMQRLHEGDTIPLAENANINIRFNPVASPASVVFEINGGHARTENAIPYSLAGDKSGDYTTWSGAEPGVYKLTATAYSEAGGNGTRGESLTVNFTILHQEESVTGECTASGTILREYWANVSGSDVASIPIHMQPTSVSQLNSFESPTNVAEKYGARIRGYICAPATGNYTFWIASNDHSELWLSTDDNPANKIRIAYVDRPTTPRQWFKSGSQKSAAIALTAGERYYIEALHKQGVGTDNLAVGWQLPDGTIERPIPGSRLSPAEGTGNSVPVVIIENPEDGQRFNSNSPVHLAFNVIANDADGTIKEVQFFANSEHIASDDTPSNGKVYTYVWKYVRRGTYTVMAKAIDNSGGIGTSSEVTFTVADETCTATGFITRDYWANVSGSRVSDIPLNKPPTSSTQINIFEGPSNVGTKYASRIRGYLCPPMTGDYTFWIASNDHSQLWLSTAEDDPSAKRLIAWVEGASGPREWDKFPSQRSGQFNLTQGKKYYIEVLHKQGMGTDHVAVGWMLPDFTTQRPIPGASLSPFDMADAARIVSDTETTTSDEKNLYSEINIYPNPVPTGNTHLRISGYEGLDETIETQVEIINLTGEVVYQERVRCGGDCSSYIMKVDHELVPGVYMVKMNTNGARFSKRLLVK